MNRNIPVTFAISALIALTLCSACTLPGNEKPVNAGLSQVTTQEISPYISFEEVQQEFADYSIEQSTGKLPIYYIFSRDVDSSGNALTWLFGVRVNTATELLMYDRTGWKIIPLNTTLPSEEILLDQVVPPGTLFSQNKQVISGTSLPSGPVRRDLALKQGIYSLTINSGSTSKTLAFNATTGELITSNV